MGWGSGVASLPGREHSILQTGDVGDLVGDVAAVEIAEPDRQGAAHLVAIAGADTAAGRADRLAPRHAAVEDAVFGHVPGEDDVGPVTDPQLALDPHAA